MKRLRSIWVLIVLAGLLGTHAVYACEWMGAGLPVNGCCEDMSGESGETTLACPHERSGRAAPCCLLTFERSAVVGTTTLAAEQQPAAKITPKLPALAANTAAPLSVGTPRIRLPAPGMNTTPRSSPLYLITQRLRI